MEDFGCRPKWSNSTGNLGRSCFTPASALEQAQCVRLHAHSLSETVGESSGSTVTLCGRIAPLTVCLSSIPELGVCAVPTGLGSRATATVTVTTVLGHEHSHRNRLSAHRLADQAPLVAWGILAVLHQTRSATAISKVWGVESSAISAWSYAANLAIRRSSIPSSSHWWSSTSRFSASFKNSLSGSCSGPIMPAPGLDMAICCVTWLAAVVTFVSSDLIGK